MSEIIKYFIKYPVLGNAIILAISFFGLISLSTTKTTLFPEMPQRDISISARWPGASPQEIAEGILNPIENELRGISGIHRFSSTASENSASIRVETAKGHSIDDLLQDIQNAVQRVRKPVDVEPITVMKVEPREPAIDIVLWGNTSLNNLKEESRRVERDLLAMPGISKISLSGFPGEEIEIAVNNNQLLAYGVSIQDITNAVRSANIRVTGGTIEGSQELLRIRTDNMNYWAEDLESIVVKNSSDGGKIRLHQVAELKNQWEDVPNRTFFRGSPAVTIAISSTRTEDLIATAATVTEYVENYEPGIGTNLEVLIDRSVTIKERTAILLSSGIQGIILVMLILGIFLRFRLAFWVSLVIPVTLLGMFILAPLYGFTINVMSLLGMILVLGLLVDHGIVIAENIYSHFESGSDPLEAALKGTKEVLPAVVGSVLTTAVIFSAFFFLEGPMGDRSRDIGFVVIATLAMSLVEALFILPAHIAHSKTLRGKSKKERGFFTLIEGIFERFRDKIYEPVLRFITSSTSASFSTLLIVTAIGIITHGAATKGVIQSTYFPPIERRTLSVSLEMPAGTVESITDSILRDIESVVPKLNDEFREQHGGRDIVTAHSRSIRGSNRGSIHMTLLPSDERVVDNLTVNSALRRVVGSVPEAENLTFGAGRGFGNPVAIALYSENYDELNLAKNHLKTEMENLSFLKDIQDSETSSNTEVRLNLLPTAEALGISYQWLSSQVRSSFHGGVVQRVQRGMDEIPIVVRYSRENRRSIDDLLNTNILSPSGAVVPLREVATISLQPGTGNIRHQDGRREVMIMADIEGSITSLEANRVIAESILSEIGSIYPSISVRQRGESEASRETTDSAQIVIPIVLFIMYLIIVFTFRSFFQAALIFILIPFSIIGVYWGHYIEGYPVSMLSLFGIIALMGIIVNDSLVYVSAFNRNIADGVPFREAVLSAGVSRLRPVLLTTLTTIGGLWPLIKLDSRHAQFLSPMGISVGYGLLFGTILTLLLLPALIILGNSTCYYFTALWNGKKPQERSHVETAFKESLFDNLEKV